MKKPKLASVALQKLAYQLLYKNILTTKVKVIDDGTLASIKPPYLLLANHVSHVDVAVLVSMLIKGNIGASVVGSMTQMSVWGKILDNLGIIAKKQFTTDATLIRDIKRVLDNNRPVIIFPEGKLSIVGKPNIIPTVTAKLAKLMKVPVVTVNMQGNYLALPRWSHQYRNVVVTPKVTVALTAEQLSNSTVDEIHKVILDNLACDEYQYQLDNNISISHANLVEGLEHILCICPHCNSVSSIVAKGNTLTCVSCNTAVSMNEYGQLQGGEFCSVSQWYDYIVDIVAKQVADNSYIVQDVCTIEFMTKGKFRKIGKGTVVHNREGITISCDKLCKHWDSKLLYTLSFDNDYVYLPTEEGIYRINIAKVGYHCLMNIATELIFQSIK